jgi:hypothetical protein
MAESRNLQTIHNKNLHIELNRNMQTLAADIWLQRHMYRRTDMTSKLDFLSYFAKNACLLETDLRVYLFIITLCLYMGA